MSVLNYVTLFQSTTAVAVFGFIVAYAVWSPWRRTVTGYALMLLAATALVLLGNGLVKTFVGTYPGMDWVRLGCYVSLTTGWVTMFVLLIRAQRRQ